MHLSVLVRAAAPQNDRLLRLQVQWWGRLALDVGLHYVAGRPVVQHRRQDVLRVLQTLRHFGIVAVQRQTKRHDRPLALFVDVRDVSALGVEEDLGAVLEIDLNYLIRKTEHRRVRRSHPFLYVNTAWRHFNLLDVLRLT